MNNEKGVDRGPGPLQPGPIQQVDKDWQGDPFAIPLSDVLNKRGRDYGDYGYMAVFAQQTKEAMRLTPGWQKLGRDQQESLDMIVTKMARILHGNPNKSDSWVDIEGYAHLISQRLSG